MSFLRNAEECDTLFELFVFLLSRQQYSMNRRKNDKNSIRDKAKEFSNYLLHYDSDEWRIVQIISFLAVIGAIIFILPVVRELQEKELIQGLSDKLLIFLITTVVLTVFLKRFFDKVDQRKFHTNLKLLCVSHKMHEVLVFCLEYFDKLSYLMDDSKDGFHFDFQSDVLKKLKFNSELFWQQEDLVTVDKFWHAQKWKVTKGDKTKEKNVRELLINQDAFYQTKKEIGRFNPYPKQKLKNEEEISRSGLGNWKEFISILQGFSESETLNKLRLTEIKTENVRKDIDVIALAKKWYIGEWRSFLEEAKSDKETMVGMVDYLRKDIYKKVYEYSDRKSADGMDPFLKLTTVLDRIDWKMNFNNRNDAEKDGKYDELFIGLEDDFIFLFHIALSIYATEEIFLPSYAAYERLVLEKIGK